MKNRTVSLLSDAVCDYLKSKAAENISESTFDRHRRVLKYFICFARKFSVKWNKLFADNTLSHFLEFCVLYKAESVIKGFSRFLYYQRRISKPVGKYHPILPEIFNRYLTYKASMQNKVYSERIVLTGLTGYLEENDKTIQGINIQDMDLFVFRQYGHLSLTTQNSYKSCLRGFLKYLYAEKVIKKNLAPLIINRRIFSMAKPPRFLRPACIKKLFGNLKYKIPKDLRANAMVYIAFTLGLRPKEISLITLDHISFKKYEITILDRKNCKPVILPLPDAAIKAISAYIIGGRAKSSNRALFLSLKPDCSPMTNGHIAKEITACMQRAGLNASAYWLRHTYAQNLLERGQSIFEIKEMMGHDNIQTTKRYLHINIKLMRKVLFNETL